MISLDFSKIRNHDGSQDNGFEELVCQLAHLSPPKEANFFVRKDGAGGDAGVECYWKLKDGSEHAWQAKYFLNSLEASQWTQISESVEAALEKHPMLKKYYLCLPRDWNDSRKKGRSGKVVTSAWDQWGKYVKRWSDIAVRKGMSVEFVYWGKHDISLMLQRDNADFSGRARYWFGVPILTTEIFSRLAQKSRLALGDRYTPEYHIELPIAEIIESLGKSNYWWSLLAKEINSWKENANNVRETIIKINTLLNLSEATNLNEDIRTLTDIFTEKHKDKSFLIHLDNAISELERLIEKLFALSRSLQNSSTFSSNEEKEIRKEINRYQNAVRAFQKFLMRNVTKAAVKNAVLLAGPAGIGKSHLLCDVAMSRIREGLPTVFILGQHYLGANPLKTLKDQLDLNDLDDESLLGALDASGETGNTKTLIIIDAINEGANREDWQNYLSAFLSELGRFKHISVIVSCRTTYIKWLIPDHIVKNQILYIVHNGFQGYEHRAASLYLSQQGIVKPSAPILSPEFTNPLFLKTCCKAMREEKLTSFPKGLNGMSSLFDFYISSIESAIIKLKRYLPGEGITKKALNTFALALYPDHQFGLPVEKARPLVNSIDSQPTRSDPLFDILMYEGILSEDIEYDQQTGHEHCVIRFTYERFSDYFIAKSLLNSVENEDFKRAFSSSGCFAPILEKDYAYHMYAGILSALSIILAEKFNQEITDYFSPKMLQENWLIDEVFLGTLTWRAPSAFSEKTLSLFNSYTEQGFQSKKIDVLLSISTEPNHPWNAELLHSKLLPLSMAKRDAIWTTHINISDDDESEGREESIERAIINWAYSGSLEGVESERIRLCAMVLIWMTSASNRKVRDQSTKSAIRLLVSEPKLLIQLMERFCDINDEYILERLYAIAYGVTTNISNLVEVKNIANWVMQKQFLKGKPTPHILIRDFASGIMEYAKYKGLLDQSVSSEMFRPPFKTSWPYSDVTLKELEAIDERSSIRSSLMGFPGDFGNYSMSCIDRWSHTLTSIEKPQTSLDLKMSYAKSLSIDLQKKMDKFLEEELKDEIKKSKLSMETIISRIKYVDTAKVKPSKLELLKNEILDALPVEEHEYFKWVMSHSGSERIVPFSKRRAQRWVLKRAYELGWEEELFGNFERYHTSQNGRSEPKIERIGKKYQWIAFHQFLAYLSDNHHFIDPGYSDADNSKYFGAWQIHGRDIDPTSLIRSTGDNGWDVWSQKFWWQPFVYPFTGESIPELESWLWDESVIPPFKDLLEVRDRLNTKWLVLRSFSNWKKDPLEDKDNIPYQDAWYRINSCIVKKSDFLTLKKSVINKNLIDPYILKPNTNYHNGYLREFPWHPSFKDITGWHDEIEFRIKDKVNHLVPVAQYEWESGTKDHSISQSIRLYLPVKEIIENLRLKPKLGLSGKWLDDNENVVFFDPSFDGIGPSSALCKSEVLFEFLEKNDLQLVWLVGGEKQLFTSMANKFFGRLVYSGIYSLNKNGVEGNLWFQKEPPQN